MLLLGLRRTGLPTLDKRIATVTRLRRNDPGKIFEAKQSCDFGANGVGSHSVAHFITNVCMKSVHRTTNESRSTFSCQSEYLSRDGGIGGPSVFDVKTAEFLHEVDEGGHAATNAEVVQFRCKQSATATQFHIVFNFKIPFTSHQYILKKFMYTGPKKTSTIMDFAKLAGFNYD
jgi:hypothetical protein